jgi:hypothetical protein
MTQTRFKKIPFNLELAKKITNVEVKGHIVTRDGRQARIICFDKDGGQNDYPIVALIQIEPTDERMYTFSKEGAYSIGNEFYRDLMIEVPTYYRDYSNFVPQMWQSCLVRDDQEEQWDIRVCFGKNKVGDVVFNEYACTYKYFLPLSKITARLIGTTKSYEQLIQELDAESTATAKNEQQ